MNRFYMFYYRSQYPGDRVHSGIYHPLCKKHGKRLKRSVKDHLSVYIVKGKKTDKNCLWCRNPKDFEIVAKIHHIDLKGANANEL